MILSSCATKRSVVSARCLASVPFKPLKPRKHKSSPLDEPNSAAETPGSTTSVSRVRAKLPLTEDEADTVVSTKKSKKSGRMSKRKYEKLLLFAAASRLAAENNVKVNEDQSPKKLREMLLSDSVRSITDEDIDQVLSRFTRKHIKREELLSLKDVLNKEMNRQRENDARKNGIKLIHKIVNRYERCKYSVQSVLLSQKIAMALPLINNFYSFQKMIVKQALEIDPTVDISMYDHPKYMELIETVLVDVKNTDCKKSYIDWLSETIRQYDLTPSFEVIILAMVILERLGETSELQSFFNRWSKIVLSDVNRMSKMHVLSNAEKDLLRLKILPSVSHTTVRFKAASGDEPGPRSVLTGERMVPESAETVAPQLNLSDIMSYKELMKKFQQQFERERQLAVQVEALDSGAFEGSKENSDALRKVISNWSESLQREISHIKHHRLNKGKFLSSESTLLKLIDTEELTQRLIDYAVYVGTMGTPVVSIDFISEIGDYLFNTFNCNYLRNTGYFHKLHLIYPRYLTYFYNRNLPLAYSPRQFWLKLDASIPGGGGPSIHSFPQPWPFHVYRNLGEMLFDILLKHCQIPLRLVDPTAPSSNKMLPCFFVAHRATYNSSRINVLITPHTFFTKFLLGARSGRVNMLSSTLPMLVPPIPWCSLHYGANLVNCNSLMRPVSDDKEKVASLHLASRACTNHPDLGNLYDSIYSLSSVPWKINDEMYDVIREIYLAGGDSDLDIALSGTSFSQMYPIASNERKSRSYLKSEREMHGLRMSLFYKLSLAQMMKKEKAFWFPASIDYRGRCYDISPVFNHIGDDATRGLLMFAQGRPLGERGFQWLKLQIASLTGCCKKMSFKERLSFVDSRLDLIVDSAENPLGGKGWWRWSDDPFQTLAVCKELRSAMNHPDPRDYVSHIPIHQDGSCNGLQHYAALGRDQPGAEKVNLVPSERPQDVYQAVADIVEQQRSQDCSNPSLKAIAESLETYVSRKTVKHTVMTSVYGVTKQGALQQVLRKLKETDYGSSPTGESPSLIQASDYLSKSVLSAIGTLFTTTQKLQYWFADLARLLSLAGVYTQWVTPLGLPVTQPYAEMTKDATCLEKTVPSTVNPLLRPAMKAQCRAFPPNYIHSLDATHMLMTSFGCYKRGVSFVSVHDCFWTHACSVDEMNVQCRKEFIRLHSLPNLQMMVDHITVNILPQVDERHREKIYRHLQALPPSGHLDINQVMDSTFFFS